MSYDIYLKKDDELVRVPPFSGGGIQQVEPIRFADGIEYAEIPNEEAWINVTWNYGAHFREHLGEEGIVGLDGKTGAETAEALQAGADALGTEKYTGPWYTWQVSAILGGNIPMEYQGWTTEELNNPDNWDEVSVLIGKGLVYDTGGYWAPMPGNAGWVLALLAHWAKNNPDAVWEVHT